MRRYLLHLPLLLPSLNQTLRDHWASRHDLMAWLNQEVMAAVGGPRHYPRPPFERARITVTRHCVNLLDEDNLAGSIKPLGDVLKAHHEKRNPLGLSFIEADDPGHCEMVARQVREKHRINQRTIVVIEELPAIHAAAEPPKKRKARRGPTAPTKAQIAAANCGALFTGRGGA